MATVTQTPETEEEQDAAHNVAQALYDREFNGITSNIHNDNADPKDEDDSIGRAKKKEKDSPDGSSRDDKSLYKKSKSSSGSSGGLGGSTGGGMSGFAGKLKAGAKKGGASGGFMGILILGMFGAGSGVVTGAVHAVIDFVELLKNDRGDGTRSNNIHRKTLLAGKWDKAEKGCKGVAIICRMSVMSGAERLEYERQGFHIKGNIVDPATGADTGKKAEEPHTAGDDKMGVNVKEIQFPDEPGRPGSGKVAHSASEYINIMDNTIDGRRQDNRMFNATKLIRSKFMKKFRADAYQFDDKRKAFPERKAGESDEEYRARVGDDEFNTRTDGAHRHGTPAGDATRQRHADEVLATVDEKQSKGGARSAGIIGKLIRGYCTAAKLGRMVETAVKAYHAKKLVKFLLVFMQAADEIKSGNGDGNKVTYLGNNLTSYDTDKTLQADEPAWGGKKGDPNPRYQKNAFDSKGFGMVQHGDKGELGDYQKQYVLGGGIGQIVAGYNSKIEAIGSNIPFVTGLTDRQKTKNFCKLATGKASNLITSCAAVGGLVQLISAPADAATLGFGEIAQGAISADICACSAYSGLIPVSVQNITNYLPGGSICKIQEELMDKLMQQIIKAITSSDTVKTWLHDIVANLDVGSDTVGYDTGEVMPAAAGLMMSRGATGYGLMPGNVGQIKDYIAYTQPDVDKDIALAKDDARRNPFDIYNEYSMAGSLFRTLDIGSASSNSLLGGVGALAAVFPASFKVLGGASPANALYSQPSEARIDDKTAVRDSKRFTQCDDEGLQDIGANGDAYCSPVAISSVEELKAAKKAATDPNDDEIIKLAQWMVDNKYIDKDGKPIDSDQSTPEKKFANNEYNLYLGYCTSAREAPWGDQFEGYDESYGNVTDIHAADIDQDYFSGKQCRLRSTSIQTVGAGNTDEAARVTNFAKWTQYCQLQGIGEGSTNCYMHDANAAATPTSSACAGGGNKAILTCALKYDDWGYEWGGGHGGNATEFVADFNAGKHPKGEHILDCSGLVRMAYTEAMGVEGNSEVTQSYSGSSQWQLIPTDQVDQGDIVVVEGGQHVAIVESKPNGSDIPVFEASSVNSDVNLDIRHGSYPSGQVVGAYRAKK